MSIQSHLIILGVRYWPILVNKYTQIKCRKHLPFILSFLRVLLDVTWDAASFLSVSTAAKISSTSVPTVSKNWDENQECNKQADQNDHAGQLDSLGSHNVDTV